MRRILTWTAAAALFAIPATAVCQQSDSQTGQQGQAQATAPQQDSLADAARKAREAKKEPAKPTHVFDNDNLPASGGISTVGTEKGAKEGDAAANDATKAASPNNEKTWRDKFAKLRAKLKRDQDDADVAQRELGVLDVANYNNDPVKTMQQELTRDDINKKTADIAAKRKQIEADQQAIDDAEEELRKSGGDVGWAR
jgi:hypothetical protein